MGTLRDQTVFNIRQDGPSSKEIRGEGSGGAESPVRNYQQPMTDQTTRGEVSGFLTHAGNPFLKTSSMASTKRSTSSMVEYTLGEMRRP